MLKGISPLLSPELLYHLSAMGHGDTVVLADAHFPGESVNDQVLRADGLRIADLLDGILPLFEIDSYTERPLVMMAAVEGDTLDPGVEEVYRVPLEKHVSPCPPITRVERMAFYDLARQAYAVVMTGELAKYGNILLTKGVTPVD